MYDFRVISASVEEGSEEEPKSLALAAIIIDDARYARMVFDYKEVKFHDDTSDGFSVSFAFTVKSNFDREITDAEYEEYKAVGSELLKQIIESTTNDVAPGAITGAEIFEGE